MSEFLKYKFSVFFVLSLVAIFALIISSVIMINQNGMNAQLQGWVNLLWLPLPLVILIVDRILKRKFGAKTVNRIEIYILAALILVFILNLVRLNVE